MASPPEICEECGNAPAIVGFGKTSRWLCQGCFEVALARVGEVASMIHYAFERTTQYEGRHDSETRTAR